MAKKYREIEKENYLRKLRRGLTTENFNADKAWRPGGKALYSAKGSDNRNADLMMKGQFNERPKSGGRRRPTSSQRRKSSKSAPKRRNAKSRDLRDAYTGQHEYPSSSNNIPIDQVQTDQYGQQ